MGHNTSVLVLNDALGHIKNDPNFGKNLAAAITHLAVSGDKQVDIPATYRDSNGNARSVHVNAATAIESHHADGTSVITIGENCAHVLSRSLFPYGGDEYKVRVLKALADEMGYYVARKPSRRKPR